MNNFNSKNNRDRVKELFDILTSTEAAIDLTACIAKLKGVLDSTEDISIVLLGSFADGKTSTIAGLMGEVLDDMKIDSDESSDELIIYRPHNLKKGYVIIDTPGLFGTKEQEIDGEKVQLSDKTIKFISEAHIVMYVTSAVAPVKESHGPILKRVLRDLDKLDSTIFVLNKMDETGANITNEEAFGQMAKIKKQFLIDRLENIIGLTPDEAQTLKVVCISADPKRKGVQTWLQTPEKYMQLSRIGTLQDSLNNVVATANPEKLRADAYAASLKDVMYTFAYIYNQYTIPLQKIISETKEDLEELNGHLVRNRYALIKTKGEMTRQLDGLRQSLLQKIMESSYEEMGTILQNDIGVEGGKVTYYVVQANVNAILSDCCMSNRTSLDFTLEEMKTKFEKEDGMFKEIVGQGVGFLKNVDNKAVLAARDAFFKSYKFKPWGAVKLADKIGKVGAGIQIAAAAYEVFKEWKRNQELKKAKKNLTDAISKYFSAVYKLMGNDDDYFKNFAPTYGEMVDILAERKSQIGQLTHKLTSVEALKSRVSVFYGTNIEDVEFEEL